MKNGLAATSLLTEEETQLREVARRFMDNEVAAATPAMEASGQLDMTLMASMGQLGLLGTFLPEAYGGSGAGIGTRAVVSEEMARVNAGLDVSVFADIILFARAINDHGTEEQKRQYLPDIIAGRKLGAMAITEPAGGSDALGASTTARREGDDYLINGHKIYITNAPVAEYILVIARTAGAPGQIEGGTWFIIERGMKGLSTSAPFNKLGLKSSPTGEVILDNVRVPRTNILGEPGRGFHYMMESLDVERVLEGASTIGIAQACLDAAAAYAQERVVFGKPIAKYQLVQEKIAEMATGIELSRTMLYHLLRAVERGEKVTREAAMLKLYSSQMAVKASSDAVQIFGGNGYMEDYPVARFFRDAKHHEIGAGTSEIQKIIISRETLKRY